MINAPLPAAAFMVGTEICPSLGSQRDRTNAHGIAQASCADRGIPKDGQRA